MMHMNAFDPDLAVAGLPTSDWAEEMDESTRMTWLWALLFGPAYFAAHGFMGRALLVLALDLVLVGIVLAPFLAYPAWRSRARESSEWLRGMLAARESIGGAPVPVTSLGRR